MQNRSLLFALLLVLFFEASSCTDQPKPQSNMLVGRWEITSALRNGRSTQLLQGTYFQFSSDSKMETNLPLGVAAPTTYEWVENSIRQSGNPPTLYEVNELTDTSLELAAEFRGAPFVFRFRKVEMKSDSSSE